MPVWVTAPEPNTWREVLSALDAKQHELSIDGRRVAVQEYGASNPDLLSGLETRGARVTRVPVYQWALPDDLGPLEAGVQAIVAGQIDVVLFTTATQVVHLLKVAGMMGLRDDVRSGLKTCAIASIGPTTSEEMREQGIEPDCEPAHPRMGFLVREAAERAGEILRKRGRAWGPPSGGPANLTVDSDNRPRRRPSEELRVHELIDHAPARLRLDTEQASGLRDCELKPRHFVEFSPDTIDERARVHSVLSLQGCCAFDWRLL